MQLVKAVCRWMEVCRHIQEDAGQVDMCFSWRALPLMPPRAPGLVARVAFSGTFCRCFWWGLGLLCAFGGNVITLLLLAFPMSRAGC
jgi:hypothetical protein